MKTSLYKIWQTLLPERFITYIRFLMESKESKTNRRYIINRYKNQDYDNLPNEIKQGIQYLKKHKFTAFPYKWANKYNDLIPQVFRDDLHSSFYIIFENKKLYFPEIYTENQVIWATRSMLREQDPQSPHKYLTEDFQINENTIIVDAGVAEGNFALSVVEKAKKLYLIECNPEWVKTLKLTFAPWKEKVVIIEKYLSGEDTDQTITLDTILKPELNEKYHIKLDIEGFEKQALTGMTELLNMEHLTMNVCTYHFENDITDISRVLENYNLKLEISEGYLIYGHQGMKPSFRKALIRARK